MGLMKIHAPQCALPGCINRTGFHKQYTKADGTLGGRHKTFCNYHREGHGKAERDAWLEEQGCANKDGRLGYECFGHPEGVLQVDHTNGNRYDNSEDNIEPLCPTCHTYKTKLQGDNQTRYTFIPAAYNDLFEEA